MGLEIPNTIERYLHLAETCIVFATSKPPRHSENLRSLGIQVKRPTTIESIEESIEPGELSRIKDTVLSYAIPTHNQSWGRFIWTNKEPDLFKTVYALIPFMDDLDNWFKLEKDYFPTDEIATTIKKFQESNTNTLDAKTQLRLLNTTPETFISNAYLISLALRVLARNADTSRGVSCKIEESVKVLKKLPAFPLWELRAYSDHDLNIATNAGDWYHFWTCIVLGALAEKHSFEIGGKDIIYKIKFWGYEFLLTNTSELTSAIRHNKNKCGFHESADKNGFMIGRMVAQKMIGL